jgi:hypothetical protein
MLPNIASVSKKDTQVLNTLRCLDPVNNVVVNKYFSNLFFFSFMLRNFSLDIIFFKTEIFYKAAVFHAHMLK